MTKVSDFFFLMLLCGTVDDAEASPQAVLKKVKALSTHIQQLGQSNVMIMKLLVSLTEDVSVLPKSVDKSKIKIPLDACFVKASMPNAILRVHVYTRLFVHEPFPTEIEMYTMFRDMRDEQEKKLVKQWWNHNRKHITKCFLLLTIFY
jgi:hypothetical protein